MKYIILEFSSVEMLQEKVQEYLNNGWELQGGVSAASQGALNWWYYQAMVLREKS